MPNVDKSPRSPWIWRFRGLAYLSVAATLLCGYRTMIGVAAFLSCTGPHHAALAECATTHFPVGRLVVTLFVGGLVPLLSHLAERLETKDLPTEPHGQGLPYGFNRDATPPAGDEA